MAVKKILLLGNPGLYQPSEEVKPEEVEKIRKTVQNLHDTLMDFRARCGFGRAVAAPQIGIFKRLVYMHMDDAPQVFINPEFRRKSGEMVEVWDACMSFPDLLVKVSRHQTCRIKYYDLDWQLHHLDLDGDLSELLQHECDHLDGILAVSRAADEKSFALRSEEKFIRI